MKKRYFYWNVWRSINSSGILTGCSNQFINYWLHDDDARLDVCIYSRWDRVGLVTTSEDLMLTTAGAFRQFMEAQGKVVTYRTIDTTVQGTEVSELKVSFKDISAKNNVSFRNK